jgi:hypothetical protein
MPTWNALIDAINQLGRKHDHGLGAFSNDLSVYTLHDEEIGILLKRVGFVVDSSWLNKAISVAAKEGFPFYTMTRTAEGLEIMFKIVS